MSAICSKLENQLTTLIHYITPFTLLINCHMVEFLTKNHWERLLPEQLRKELEGSDNLLNFKFTSSRFWDLQNSLCKDNSYLDEFITITNSHSLVINDYSISAEQLQDKLTSRGGRPRPEIHITAFMNNKKSYEVATMSRLVASVYDATSSTCCLEAGGGRGHLLVALSLGYRIPSLTVDCDEEKLRAATERVKLIQKQWHAITKPTKEKETTARNSNQKNDTERQDSNTDLFSTCSYDCTISREPTTLHKSGSSDSINSHSDGIFHPDTNPAALHRFAAAYITRDSNLVALVEDKFPELVDNVKVLLTGLHTCGDLGPSSLRIFASQPSSAALFNVPCCYNLLTEGIGNNSGFPMSKYLKGFKLGRNARMLATQSLDRVRKEQKIPPKSLLYRAMLEVLIQKHLPNVTVAEGKLKRTSSKCDNFDKYFKMADAILNLGLYHSLSQSCHTEICNDMELQWRRLVTFYMLRLRFAPVIESIILLDRLLFLIENGCENVFLVKLFDPILSPRCYGIVALK